MNLKARIEDFDGVRADCLVYWDEIDKNEVVDFMELEKKTEEYLYNCSPGINPEESDESLFVNGTCFTYEKDLLEYFEKIGFAFDDGSIFLEQENRFFPFFHFN